jgi:hypothetical protein
LPPEQREAAAFRVDNHSLAALALARGLAPSDLQTKWSAWKVLNSHCHLQLILDFSLLQDFSSLFQTASWPHLHHHSASMSEFLPSFPFEGGKPAMIWDSSKAVEAEVEASRCTDLGMAAGRLSNVWAHRWDIADQEIVLASELHLLTAFAVLREAQAGTRHGRRLHGLGNRRDSSPCWAFLQNMVTEVFQKP